MAVASGRTGGGACRSDIVEVGGKHRSSWEVSATEDVQLSESEPEFGVFRKSKQKKKTSGLGLHEYWAFGWASGKNLGGPGARLTGAARLGG